MPGQGVGVDQALGSGSNGSPATLGRFPAPAATRGTGPQLATLPRIPFSDWYVAPCLPGAEQFATQLVSLPIYPRLPHGAATRLAEALAVALS